MTEPILGDRTMTGKQLSREEVREIIYGGSIDDEYLGQIWGISGAPTASHQASDSQSVQQQDVNTPSVNGATIYQNGGTPSTPNNGPTALASTPGPTPNIHSGIGSGVGPLTPGGGGGVFGSFQLGKQ